MSDELKNILTNLNKDIEQEKLLEYLNKSLSAETAHDVEKQMADDEFLNDAMEGLENIGNKKDLPRYVEQLNQKLHKQLDKKKSRRDKRKLKDQPWIFYTIVLLLLLMVISFILIKKYLHN